MEEFDKATEKAFMKQQTLENTENGNALSCLLGWIIGLFGVFLKNMLYIWSSITGRSNKKNVCES